MSRPRASTPEPEPRAAVELADLVLGLVLVGVTAAGRAVRAGDRLLSPLARRLLRPPVLAERFWPESVLRHVALGGRRQRVDGVAALEAEARALLPVVLEAVLAEIDLTQLVAEHVDLDVLARRLDLDAAVARVDLDAAVARVDLDRIVDRVPIDRVLDRVDVDEVAARLDVDAVLARVDLIGLARYVIDGVDLPEIVRDSTGSMASEGLREVRLQTIDADERVNRIVDRLLLRRQARRTDVAGET